MKVKELIEKLQKFDQEAEIMFADGWGDEYPINIVIQDDEGVFLAD